MNRQEEIIMSNVAAVDIDVAEVMSHQENQSAAEQLKAALEANPAVSQMMEAAQSVEEMYDSVKEYISLKLEDFKVLFDKTIEYFKGPKVALEDEMMECVVGGWSFSNFWNKYKKTICAVVVVAGMAVLGAAAGAVIGVTAAVLAGTTMVTGGTIGAVGGAIVSGIAGGLIYKAHENDKP